MIRPGAPLDHVRQHRLAHEERAGQVDRQHLVPVLVGHLQHGLVDRDPGVVDEDVEAPVLLDDLVDGAPAVLRRADVALVERGGQPVLGQRVDERLGGLLIAAVAGRDVGALLGQAAADGRADPARAAGDERDASVQAGTVDTTSGWGRWLC